MIFNKLFVCDTFLGMGATLFQETVEVTVIAQAGQEKTGPNADVQHCQIGFGDW